MKARQVIIALFLLFSTNFVFSQSKPWIGLSGTLQGSQFGISVPMWLGEKFVLAPSIDIMYVEDVGADFGFALATRFYLREEAVKPYYGLRGGALFFTPSSETFTNLDTRVDYLLGGLFGLEYFITPHLSAGVEAQANFTKSDEFSTRFGNPDKINFNTATMVSITIYF
ncbi:MAG: hypothetical protein EA393_06705 [Bacteroidetes bacterium]|nr:MAG: hypothetical protein EA393_06705 [Bacteroidota bacterium]